MLDAIASRLSECEVSASRISHIDIRCYAPYRLRPMARTTVDIDDPVLDDLRRLQRKQGKSLGRLISDLLSSALSQQKNTAPRKKTLQWISRNMGEPLVDLDDKDAVQAVLDEESARKLKGRQ